MMLDSEIKGFKNWLIDQGAEILPATNSYEALRFIGSEVGVLYTSGRTSSGYVNNAIGCFRHKKPWDGKPVNVGRKNSYVKQKARLLKRDGCNCFYCGLPLGDDITVEHLIALSSGGLNTLANMVLAHELCNNRVRNLPITQKINIAIENRIKLITIPHDKKEPTTESHSGY